MLGSLTGTVTAHLDQRTLIEVGGVGYWVFTGSWQPDGQTTAYLHHVVREDASDLFGFADLASLELFEKLISISGIGPKAGLALLSLGSADDLKSAILRQDAAYLSSAPGIGQKAAQKIILELQNKIGALAPIQGPTNLGHTDLISALEGLGYRPQEARQAIKDLPADLSLDEQIKWSLRQIT